MTGWTRAAVGFVDLLGSKAYASSEDPTEVAVAIEDALQQGETLVPDMHSLARTFTDNTVITVPIASDSTVAAGLRKCVELAAHFSLGLSCKGFFLRGGISVDMIYNTPRMSFGPALVEAYELESREAVFPRVVLGHAAAELGVTGRVEGLAIAPDGLVFVDYLAAAAKTEGLMQSLWASHRAQVLKRLKEYDPTTPIWLKYWWLAQYHNWKTASAGLDDLVIGVPGGEDLGFRHA